MPVGSSRQQDLRLIDQSPRNGDPLLLTTRQAQRELMLLVGEPNLFEHVKGAPANLLPRQAQYLEADGNVLLDRAARQQLKVLEDDPHIASQKCDGPGSRVWLCCGR